MKQKILKKCLIVTAITFTIGLLLILSSVSIGRNISLGILMENGGMVTSEYEFY